MTLTERHAADAACLRLLYGWKDPQFFSGIGWRSFLADGSESLFAFSPSGDPTIILPLAEAVRAKGGRVTMQQVVDGCWEAKIVWGGPNTRKAYAVGPLPEALVLTTARWLELTKGESDGC